MSVHAACSGHPPVLVEGVGGQGDDRESRPDRVVKLPDRPGRLITVHDRHLNVHQDQAVFFRIGLQDLVYGSLSVLRCVHQETNLLEKLCLNLQIELIVVHQKDFPAAEKVSHNFLCVQVRGGLFGSRGQPEIDREGAAAAGTALYFDMSGHHFHKISGEREPQSGAEDTAGGGVGNPFKRLKDPFQICFFNADSIVPDRELIKRISGGRLLLLSDRQRYMSVVRRVFYCVAAEIDQDLDQFVTVTADLLLLRPGSVHPERDMFGLCPGHNVFLKPFQNV